MEKFKKALILVVVGSLGLFLFLGTNTDNSSKKLRHVVAFEFRSDVSRDQINELSQKFHALKKEIPQIMEFEGGADIAFLEKGQKKKYTHCFIVTVKDEKDLAAYGAHPDHQAFSESALKLVKEVMVIDYWIE